MTDTNQTPEPSAAETPTAPLPTTPEAAPAAGSMPVAEAAAPAYAEQPAHHHGMHVQHAVSEGAIVIMVVGVLLFGALSFGVGWHTRTAVARFQASRGGAITQGYGPGGFKSGGMMRGGHGKRFGQYQGQGQGQGYGQQLPPGHPSITN